MRVTLQWIEKGKDLERERGKDAERQRGRALASKQRSGKAPFVLMQCRTGQDIS